jgi:short-chain fatty acids transporter
MSTTGSSRGVFTALGDRASNIVQRYLPDAFIFALMLTFLTMILAVLFTDKGPIQVVTHWGEGFWFVLAFSMQASLALLTGWAFADSPPIKRVLGRVAKIPKSQKQAVFATTGYLAQGNVSFPLAVLVGTPLLVGVVAGWKVAHLIDPN